MKGIVITSTILLYSFSLYSQCTLTNTTYKEGEILSYNVYYNWGFIWLDAGWVDFKVLPGKFRGREIYHFDSFGSSHKSYDWLYKVRDRYQCYLDKETLKPLWFHRQNSEGGFELDNQYEFDWDKNRVFSATRNSDKPFSKDTLSIPDCTFDVLSLIYYTRNLDFNNFETGEKIPLSSIIDNEVFNLYVRYLGKETIKDRNKKEYNCHKFSVLLVEGTIFKGGEDMFVWVTDDKNKIPVLVEAKILIGSVKAYFTSATGLRYATNY